MCDQAQDCVAIGKFKVIFQYSPSRNAQTQATSDN